MQLKAFEWISSRKWKLPLLQNKCWLITKLKVSFVYLRRPIKVTPKRLKIKVCTTTRSEVVPSPLDFFNNFAFFFLGQMIVLL
jgi:hypothetical protein